MTMYSITLTGRPTFLVEADSRSEAARLGTSITGIRVSPIWDIARADRDELKGDWDTRETILHLANTEPLYREAIAHETVETLRETFGDVLVSLNDHIDPAKVDWDEVFEYFEDDRAEYQHG